MTHRNATLHPAMTAIAAVLAFSSTSLFAQTAAPPVVTAPAAPIAVTPAPVAATPVAPTPVAADPVAPAPVAETPAAADPIAPKATATTAKATATKTTAARSRPATTVTKAARTVAAAPAVAAAPPAAEPPIVQALPVQPEVAATPVVAPADQPPATTDMISNNMLPIAGAAGLGILILAGTGLAVRRRRRRAQKADDAAWQDDVETAADPVAEPARVVEPQHEPELRVPAFVAAPAPSPVPVADLTPVEGPTTTLPEGFDLSRFSPNVQAAYSGPTEDNPSLSLKHRLSKASAMDQMERNAEAEAATVAAPTAEAAVAKPATADPAKEDFMFAKAKKPSMRPAHTN